MADGSGGSGRFAGLAARSKDIQEQLARRRAELEENRAVGIAVLCGRRFNEVHGRYMAAALTLNLFLAFLPLAILAFAWATPSGAHSSTANAVIRHLGLEGRTASVIRQMFASVTTNQGAATVLGTVGFLVLGFDVAATLQETYARAWHVPRQAGIRAYLRGGAWFLAALVLLAANEAAAWTSWHFGIVFGVPAAMLALSAVFGFWLLTPRLLLDKDLGWRGLVPTAVAGTVMVAVMRVSSRFVMPNWLEYYGGPFGAIGVVLAMLFWLLIVSYGWVAVACIGAVWWERTSDPEFVLEVEVGKE